MEYPVRIKLIVIPLPLSWFLRICAISPAPAPITAPKTPDQRLLLRNRLIGYNFEVNTKSSTGQASKRRVLKGATVGEVTQ